MGPRPQNVSKGAPGGLRPAAILINQALLSRATALARRGCYDSAELVLTGLPRDIPEGLDLLARIRAQQGRMLEAAGLWTEALRLDPNNTHFRAGLLQAQQRPWNRWTRPLVAACLGSILILGGGLGLGLRTRKPEVPNRKPMIQEPAAPRQQKTFGISIPGVVQSNSGSTTVLRFDSGLFSRTILLTAEGKESLAAVGRNIEPHWRQSTLTVVGYTDDLPIARRGRFQDNEALAVARADTVIRFLSTITNVPVSAWAIRRPADVRCLFPCDSIAGRLKNRSVEILVAPGPGVP